VTPNRHQLLDQLEGVLQEASQRQRDEAIGQGSFLDLLQAAPKPPQTAAKSLAPSVAETRISSAHQQEQLRWEKELLGFFVSGHPLEAFAGLDNVLNTLNNEEELIQAEDRSLFRICGVISNVQKRFSKKSNNPWAAFTLSTRKESWALSVFSKTYEQYQGLLNDLEIVVIEGSVMKREGEETRMMINKIERMNNALPDLVKSLLWVLEPGPLANSFIKLLRETLNEHPGSCIMRTGFAMDNDDILVADIAYSLRYLVQGSSFRTLRKHSAVLGVIPEIAPIQVPQRRWTRNNSEE
jgi:DNA polymerase-3 subunit alpha